MDRVKSQILASCLSILLWPVNRLSAQRVPSNQRHLVAGCGFRSLQETSLLHVWKTPISNNLTYPPQVPQRWSGWTLYHIMDPYPLSSRNDAHLPEVPPVGCVRAPPGGICFPSWKTWENWKIKIHFSLKVNVIQINHYDVGIVLTPYYHDLMRRERALINSPGGATYNFVFFRFPWKMLKMLHVYPAYF